MKIIFLDIDGVLNSTRSAIAMGGYPAPNRNYDRFDMVAVELIRRICSKDVKIVLSSTWRKCEGWRKILNLPIIDKTEDIPALSCQRGKEIDEWLQKHSDVEEYVIIDDDIDMLPKQFEFFVNTDSHNGFLYKDYKTVCRILNIKE
jgi:hypothetical protein